MNCVPLMAFISERTHNWKTSAKIRRACVSFKRAITVAAETSRPFFPTRRCLCLFPSWLSRQSESIAHGDVTADTKAPEGCSRRGESQGPVLLWELLFPRTLKVIYQGGLCSNAETGNWAHLLCPKLMVTAHLNTETRGSLLVGWIIYLFSYFK